MKKNKWLIIVFILLVKFYFEKGFSKASFNASGLN